MPSWRAGHGSFNDNLHVRLPVRIAVRPGSPDDRSHNTRTRRGHGWAGIHLKHAKVSPSSHSHKRVALPIASRTPGTVQSLDELHPKLLMRHAARSLEEVQSRMGDPLRKYRFWSEETWRFKEDQQRLRSFAQVCSGSVFSGEHTNSAWPGIEAEGLRVCGQDITQRLI